MFYSIVAIIAGLALLSVYSSGLMHWLAPFATVIGLGALISGLVTLNSSLGIVLLLAGLVLSMNTLYAVPSIGRGLKAIGVWLSHFRLPLGLVNLVLGIGFLF